MILPRSLTKPRSRFTSLKSTRMTLSRQNLQTFCRRYVRRFFSTPSSPSAPTGGLANAYPPRRHTARGGDNSKRHVLVFGAPRWFRFLFAPGGTGSTLARTQELDPLRDDLVLVALLAFRGFPGALLQVPVHEHRPPLGQVLRAALGLFAPDHDGHVAHLVPALPALRGVGAVHRQIEVAHRRPAGRVPKLGVAGQIPHQDDLVEAGHVQASAGAASTGAGALALIAFRRGACTSTVMNFRTGSAIFRWRSSSATALPGAWAWKYT